MPAPKPDFRLPHVSRATAKAMNLNPGMTAEEGWEWLWSKAPPKLHAKIMLQAAGLEYREPDPS